MTGAARGIGEAIGRAFVNEGARVWLTDINDDLGRDVASSLGADVIYRNLDVREESAWTSVVGEVMEREGRLDVVVNNAGITGFEQPGANGEFDAHDPEHASLAAWRRVHATNLDGVFLGCRAAIRAMRPAGHGSIINISSRSGLVGIPAAAAYASSKAAVRNHTKSVALYCASQQLNIRCNSVHPAAILTPMWEPMLGPDDAGRAGRMAGLVRDTPMQRFGTAEEVAAVVVLLASDEAAYMTGTELTLDGGLLAGSAVQPIVDSDS